MFQEIAVKGAVVIIVGGAAAIGVIYVAVKVTCFASPALIAVGITGKLVSYAYNKWHAPSIAAWKDEIASSSSHLDNKRDDDDEIEVAGAEAHHANHFE